MSDIIIEKYFSKAFVVRGSVEKYKSQFKKIGGTWNSKLKGGPGWIFSNRVRSKFDQIIIQTKQVKKEVDDIVKNVKKCTITKRPSIVEKLEDIIEKEVDDIVENVKKCTITKRVVHQKNLEVNHSNWLDDLEKKLKEIEILAKNGNWDP